MPRNRPPEVPTTRRRAQRPPTVGVARARAGMRAASRPDRRSGSDRRAPPRDRAAPECTGTAASGWRRWRPTTGAARPSARAARADRVLVRQPAPQRPAVRPCRCRRRLTRRSSRRADAATRRALSPGRRQCGAPIATSCRRVGCRKRRARRVSGRLRRPAAAPPGAETSGRPGDPPPAPRPPMNWPPARSSAGRRASGAARHASRSTLQVRDECRRSLLQRALDQVVAHRA